MHANRASRVVPAWALALVVAALFSVQVTAALRDAGQRLGFAAEQGPRGVLVASVHAGQPADRAGLRAGDQIVAVDGRPVTRLAEYDAHTGSFRRGRPVTLRVLRGGTVLSPRVVPGVALQFLPFAMNGLAAAGFLAVAVLALFQGLGELRVRLLFAFTATVALEITLPLQAIVPAGIGDAMFSAFYLLTGLQIGVQLHLASLIPERHPWLRDRPWIVPLYYAAGLGLGAAACAAGLTGMPWSLEAAERLLLDWGLPVWSLAVTLLLAVQALGHPEPRGRHQAGLVLTATIPWMVFALSTTVLERSGVRLPAWTGSLEALILLGYPAAFFIAIFRYHLFDIELVVRRGLIYTTLTGSLALVFYATLGLGSAVFSRFVEGPAPVWTVSASTLLLGLVFAPLRRSLHRLIDRRFFPERVALRQELIALAGELPALGKLPLMGERLVERLTAIFLARSATLLIANPETGLFGVLATSRGGPMAADSPADDPESLTVPLIHQERLIGQLVVSRKEGSRTWPAEEVDLLGLLAHHVAAVLENARLFESATYEGLTGLLRREAILERLDRELERALRYGRPLAVAIADLDHFKRVNDQLGHLAGDALLRRVAQVLAGGLRAADRVGRYGGEEFLLVLPETDLEGAFGVAEKIRLRIQGMNVAREDGTPSDLTATVSIGLAVLEGNGDRATGRDLIAAADRRLYEAKAGGRNRVCPDRKAPDQKAIISPTLPSAWKSPSPSS